MSGFAVRTHPSYSDIEKGCSKITNTLLRYQNHSSFRMQDIDCIVGLSRGGLIPAVIISHALDLPMIPIRYSSQLGRGETKDLNIHLPSLVEPAISGTGELPRPLNIFIVDDIVDSGNTLHEVQQHYMREGNRVTTAALYYKQCTPPKHVPDIWWKQIPQDSKWISFPWE